MAVQINVAANQAALTASIQAGVQAYNQRFAQNNPINLSINQRAFSQPLGRMTGDVKDFEAALAASNARVIAFGASTAVLGGVIRSFKELANVTIDVEKNLADINRVFGLTTSQLQKFSTDLFGVGKQTASSFDDASKAALEFSRQGLKAEEVLIRTKDALTLTRLAGISTANAVDALTSTVNGFAATGISTTQILNKLVAVEQDYAVGAGDLAEALSRTGQAAQEAGVSLDQLNALVTSAQQSTARGGAVIGNALKTIFTRLQRTDTLDQLEAFNISVRDVQGNILPAVQILQNFAGAYKGLADAQRAQLSEQVAGVYQVNILKAIVGDLNKSQGVYAGALQRGASATNEAEVATAKLNQTLDALLKQTATSTQQLANNIGKVTFEPLARYGTEQLKSLVESMNEILEGEGVGSTFANGLLKGIRNVIAGPGAIAAFFTLFKLIQNSFTYLAQALPQIAGITTETQNRKNIEQSILQIMQQQGPVSQALAGSMGNQAAQAQLLLQLARQQTAEYQIQSTLAKQLATQLAGQGVRVKGSGGLQVTRAGGYIPNATRMAEAVGAQAGGYAPGKVVKSPVGGVMNTAEDVKYVPGFAQPFINPPAGSKAGRTHRQNAISRTGVDPYVARGFIPNFAAPQLINVSDDGYEIVDGDTIKADATIKKLTSFRLSKVDAAESDQKFGDKATKVANNIYPNAKDFASTINVSGTAAYNRGLFDSDKLINELVDKGYGVPDLRYFGQKFLLNQTLTAKRKKKGIWGEISNDQFVHPKAIQFIDQLKTVDPNLYKEVFSYSAGRSFDLDVDSKKFTKKQNLDLYEAALSGRDKYNFSGFIPNFATPMTTASIPWFKKYSSKYKNASGDTDLFKMGDFPTYGRGLDHEYAKKGNSAMLSYLHEDFVRSALNIALGSKKIIRPADVGFKNKPVSDISNENDFDLLYRIADGSYDLIELKQDFKNISGSVTGFMNKKLENAKKENPELVKKVRSMIAVSNRPKFTDPTGRNAGANFSEFEMAAASIVKDKYSNVDPSTSAKLTKVTDGLLRRYEAKKNTTSGGFIPNFAYKQAVMGLEESMSGEKAVFDTKPFPHIRNKSQPTFSSAIADHGGLNNALSDSMRGQKDAGLMSKGYVPNFAKGNKGKRNQPRNTQSSSNAVEVENYIENYAKEALRDIKGTYKSTIDKIKSMFLKVDSSVSSAGMNEINSLRQRTFRQTGAGAGGGGGGAGGAGGVINKALNNPVLAMMTPIITSAVASQFAFGDKKRSQLTESERGLQNFANTGVTSMSTGAFIGNMILPGWGAAIGAGVGALIGLNEAINATKLSVEELTELNREEAQKTQANITAASSYVEAQKSLTEMIVGGASSSDIEIANKKLLNGFNEIADVKLQEIFLSTGGNIVEMTKRLQEYTNETTKKSAIKKGLLETSSIEDRASALNIGFNKDQKASFVKNLQNVDFRNLKKQQEGLTLADQIFSGDYVAEIEVGIFNAIQEISKEALKSIGVTPETDVNFETTLKSSTQQLLAMSASQLDKLIAALEKSDLVGGVQKEINNFREIATKSFAEIFRKIERDLNKNLFEIALSFEKDSSTRRIQSAILDFSMNFQDSINSFISSNLPDARKFDFTAATAGQKAQMLLQKSQQDYDKAIAEQDNEKSNFLTKNAQELSGSFKSTLSTSQVNAEFYKNKVLPQIQSGNYSGDVNGIISGLKEAQFAKVQEARYSANMATGGKKGLELGVGLPFNNPEEIKTTLASLAKILENTGISEEERSKIIAYQQELVNLQETTLKFANQAEKDKLSAILTEKAEAQTLFEQKQTNAKKELEINKQLNEARIAVDKDIAIEKAKVDKQILMRMESMKDVSAQIGNTLEISKANINASIAALQSNLEDSRQNYGKGSSQILERKIDIQDSILKQQRELEDQTIKSEIQQRILQMAAEQENTAATLMLNDTIMALIETQLSEALGGSNNIQEMQNNPYIGMSGQQIDDYLEKRQQDLGAEYNPSNEESRIIEAKSYSPQNISKYQAFQRIQESRTASAASNTGYNTSNFAANMETAGFNKTDENGNLMMSTQEQINFLSKEELKAKEANNIVLEGTIKRYKEEIRVKEKSLSITRKQLDNSIALKNEENRAMVTFSGRLSAGFGKLSDQADNIIHNLAEELPMKFADNMSSALMEVAKGTKSIGDAFQDMAINFGQMIMQEVMRAAIAKTLGNIGIGSLFGQAGGNVSSRGIGYQHGGVIRANNGQYVSGMGSGDRYPAMLENGEYVLNRKAVKELGGKKSLDAFNFQQAPRFASGGNVNMEAEMALNKDQEMDYTKNLLYNNSNIGAINENDYTAYAYSENDYFKKMREKAIADEQKRVQKAFDKKQKNAQLISSIVGAAGSLFLGAGMSGLANSGVSGAKLSATQTAQLKKAGVTMNPSGLPNMQRGGVMHFANGGFVPHGSRLSDTIPALLTGGEYVMNNAAVRKYGLGEMNAMNAGAVSNNSNSNATNTNNNTNNNATNISINIDRSGKATYGSDTSSYEKNDIAFSKQMAKRVADIAKGVISDETRYGGKINQR